MKMVMTFEGPKRFNSALVKLKAFSGPIKSNLIARIRRGPLTN